MDNLLDLTIVQTKLKWHSPRENRARLDLELAALETDLIVLPEMFSTGFTMEPSQMAESMDGETVLWMKDKARELDAAICGSVVIEENGKYYNRALFVLPSGTIYQYDKRHLFTMAGEHLSYEPGSERLVVEYKGWKICPLICYDLRFPVFSRNDVAYDLLIYVANWPDPRIGAWDALLKARAIENMCFTAGVNRIGTDPNGHRYTGHSQVLDCFGNVVANCGDRAESQTIRLDRQTLYDARKKFPFLEDRDFFKVM